jgi:hypothetical protein
MVEYRIKISYATGNSFDSEDTTKYLELTWQNIDIAKENLLRIKEHYEMHRNIEGYGSKLTKEQWFAKNKDKEWFVNKPKLFCISSNNAINEKDKNKVGEGDWEYRPDDYYADHCLNLKADNGNSMQISAFWCGGFETLYGAKIELNNDDMKISF